MSETQKEKAAAMHEATGIGTLIERAEAATGSDRDLDLALVERFGTRHPNGVYSCAGSIGIAQLTGSIDAAAALISRIVPDAEGSVDVGRPCMESGRYRASICVSGKPGVSFVGNGASPPLALLLALLHGVEDGILRSLQENQT